MSECFVSHDETVRLTFAGPETRQAYLGSAIEDFVRGEFEDSRNILHLFLRVQNGFEAAASELKMTAAELDRRMEGRTLPSREMRFEAASAAIGTPSGERAAGVI